MRNKVLLLIAVMVFSLVFPTNLNVGYATENGDTDELDIAPSYYFIYYNGEKQDISLNKDVVLHLNGWTDDTQTSVQGYLSDRLGDHEVFSMNVGEEREQLSISDEDSILYRIAPSESYKAEQVEPVTFTDQTTVVTENDNGTSIEEIKTVDEYGTIVHNQGLTYYSTDENQQKTVITKEEYDALNLVTDPSSSEDAEETATPSEEVSEELPTEDKVEQEKDQDASLEKAETEESKSKEEPTTVMPKAEASRALKAAVVNPSINYSSYVEGIKWQLPVKDGELSGTSGQAKRLEAVKIFIENATYSGGVTYKTHVQGYGWMTEEKDGAISGAPGENKRMEAIQIELTGEMAKHYDVYYRLHVQTFGWLGWAKNGASAGTEGLSKRVEAVEIKLVEKGAKAPGSTDKSFITKPSVTYSTHVQTIGWQNAVSNGELSGTSGQSKRLEGIRINLTGDMAKHYDIYYRVHAQSYGWLGWAKNGMKAGTEGLSKRLEAIQIKLVPKGSGSSVSATKAFKKAKSVFLDPGHGGSDPGAMAGGYTEAGLNLAVAKKVEKLLKDRGYIVYMSRTSDTYLSLLDRSKKANELNPDIFVSIHHNSTGSGSTTASGIESYYYKYNPAYPSVINSDKHNDPNRVMKSTLLADLIQNEMISATDATNRGIDGETLAVLRETAVPATVLELGFINNTAERKKLVTSSYQNKLAKAITDGIEEYFERF